MTTEPVCRVITELPVTNILSNLTDPPGSYAQVPLNPTGYALLPLLLPQYNLIGSTTLNYSTSLYGVVWRINNDDTDLDANDVDVRWEVGEYQPPNGTTEGEIIAVPYRAFSGTEVPIPSFKTLWLFSRTNNSHKLYGNADLFCDTVLDCASKVPMDPPSESWFLQNIIYEELDDPSVLPECECYVNVPCSAGVFQFFTDRDVNVTDLDPAPPQPEPEPPLVLVPIYPECTPYPEICNGLDDDCDGIIDNVVGSGLPCENEFAGGPCVAFPGVLQCNATSGQVECVGAVYPSAEKCDFTDHDCDGVAGNVPGLGLPCGSDVGICTMGTLQCVTFGAGADCVGGTPPEPAEICGNGLDDDCNGLIDDGCTNQPSSPAGSSPTIPSSDAGESPSISTPSPQQDDNDDEEEPQFDTFWAFFLWLLGFNTSSLGFNGLAAFIALFILLLIVISCILTSSRHSAITFVRAPRLRDVKTE